MTDVIPRYTKEQLEELTVKPSKDNTKGSLTKICVKYGIRKGLTFYKTLMYFIGKTKDDYIANIIQQVEHAYKNAGEINQVENYIKTKFFKETSPIHKTYVTWFNAVDMTDR